ILIAQRRVAAAERATFLVMLCLFASYAGYFAVPATGPNVNVLALYPAHFSGPMPGVWVAERIRQALYDAEAIKHDCWPPGPAARAVRFVEDATASRAAGPRRPRRRGGSREGASRRR